MLVHPTPGSKSMNLRNCAQRKHTTLPTPEPCRRTERRCRAEKLEVEKLSGTCFLVLLSLQVAIGRLPGKGKYIDTLVAMDLLFVEIYMCLVI